METLEHRLSDYVLEIKPNITYHKNYGIMVSMVNMVNMVNILNGISVYVELFIS